MPLFLTFMLFDVFKSNLMLSNSSTLLLKVLKYIWHVLFLAVALILPIQADLMVWLGGMFVADLVLVPFLVVWVHMFEPVWWW